MDWLHFVLFAPTCCSFLSFCFWLTNVVGGFAYAFVNFIYNKELYMIELDWESLRWLLINPSLYIYIICLAFAPKLINKNAKAGVYLIVGLVIGFLYFGFSVLWGPFIAEKYQLAATQGMSRIMLLSFVFSFLPACSVYLIILAACSGRVANNNSKIC